MVINTIKTRSEISKEECTCNPIFLFQKGIVRIYPDMPINYNSELEEIFDLNGNPLSDDEILDNGFGYIEWMTEHVWATREEAEEWGRTHAYRYRASDGKDGRQGNEWQVFCVPCNGVLSKALLTHDIKSKTKGD